MTNVSGGWKGGLALGATLALGQRHYNVQIYTMQPSANHKM
jgi:hypothetical protein